MSQLTHAASPGIDADLDAITVPIADLAPWAIFAVLLATVALYFVGTEQGALTLLSGDVVHEWVHDGRHLLGFPCH